MKVIVDELPINPRYDCPFIHPRYGLDECRLDDRKCECDDDEGCRWLAPFNKMKRNTEGEER
jgi:hypothetical protein